MERRVRAQPGPSKLHHRSRAYVLQSDEFWLNLAQDRHQQLQSPVVPSSTRSTSSANSNSTGIITCASTSSSASATAVQALVLALVLALVQDSTGARATTGTSANQIY